MFPVWMKQTILKPKYTSFFLLELLSPSFQWQGSCEKSTVHLCGLDRDPSMHTPHTSKNHLVDIQFELRHVKERHDCAQAKGAYLWQNCFIVIFLFCAELQCSEHIFLGLPGQDLGFVYSKSKWYTNSEVAFGHLAATSSSYAVLKHFLVCKSHLSFL